MSIRSERVLVTSGRDSVRRVARRLAVTDAIVVIWAVVGAQLFRFGAPEENPANGPVSSAFNIDYTTISVTVAVLWLASLHLHSAYDPRTLGHGIQEYRAVTTATLRLLAALAIVSYLLKLELARGYVLVAFPAGLLVLLLTRRLWRSWLGAQRSEGAFLDQVLVIGDVEHVRDLVRDLRAAPEAGFAVVGACSSTSVASIDGIPVLGAERDAADIAQSLGVDVVACSASWSSGPDGLRRLGWALEGTGIELVVSPGLTDVAGPRIHARPVAGLPLIYVEAPTFTGMRRAMKSAFDVTVALVLLILLSPVFAVVALRIRAEDRGPVFYRQTRVGLNGRRFLMLKFRSMYVGADAVRSDENDADGPLFKLREDPRVTRVGRFIRKYSIDELPQLVNVLRGDMSLVGPRPPLASEVAEYERDVHRRLLVKPGLTGLWQVSGRSDLSWEDSVRLDLYYVENWSFTTDLRILVSTARAVYRSEGAY